MLLLLDNYDSFTYNLYDYFVQCGVQIEVVRNDEINLSTVLDKYDGIIISPGPGRPENAGKTMEIIKHFHKKLPILGICLGMQAIGQFFNAKLIRSKVPTHGKTSELSYDQNHFLFKDIVKPFEVCRYHSLVLTDLSKTPFISIATSERNEPMAIVHQEFPIVGFQFHPEAILTSQGIKLISNWLSYSRLNNKLLKQ